MRIACVGMFVVIAPQHSARADGIFFNRGKDKVVTNTPVGTRQRIRHGKVWPPRPRPTGPHQPYWHKYHAATYWPWPYVCQDRAIVEATAFTQVENGWYAATTLYDYHFDNETGELNSSGVQHLRWILTHVPEEYQQVFVASSFDPKTTEARTMSVQSELESMSVQRHVPISLRTADPLTRDAEVVEEINRGAVNNTPPPVINYKGIDTE